VEFRRVVSLVTIIIAALAITIFSQAQSATTKQGQNVRYKLIDLGTFGGPTSYESVSGFGNRVINNAGQASGWADTSIPDPYAPNCFGNDGECFLTHAFQWRDGIRTDLGGLPGVNSSAAGGINARGGIVGESQNGEIDPLTGLHEVRAVLWKEGHIVDLGTFGGNESVAVYVNDGGQVVGIADNSIPDPFSFLGTGNQNRTFLWDGWGIRDLGTLGGPDALPSGGCRNQRNGLVAGLSYTNSTPNPETGIPTVAPFLWLNGTMTDLGTLGGTFGFAQCANTRGQVAGESDLAGDLTAHPFFWDRGVLTDIGTLGGDFGTAFWINDAGEVVGWADVPGSEVHHAFLWRSGTITDLGILGMNSAAFAINSNHQVVGRSRIDQTTVHGMLWENGGPMLDLNDLIPAGSMLELVDAFDINDQGEIAALGVPPGVIPDPESSGAHALLLIPSDRNDSPGRVDDPELTTDVTQRNAAALAVNPITSKQIPPTPRENVAAWRARMARRYHIPALGGEKNYKAYHDEP
jgi:probable HAF family extracellular repeat protein